MANDIYAPIGYTPMQPDKPGYVDAVNSVRRDRMAEAANMMGLESMLTGNQQAQFNLQRDQQNQPFNLDKLRDEAMAARGRMENPAYYPAMQQGDIDRAGALGIDLKVKRGTADSSIAEQNSANEIKALTNHLMRVQAVGSQNPLLGQAEYQRVMQTVSPELKSIMPGMYDPKSINETLNLLSQTPAHRGEMEKTHATNAMHIIVGQGNNRATVEAASLRAKAKVKDLLEQFESAKTPEQMHMYGTMILMDPEVDAQTKQQVQAGVNSASRLIAEKNAKGQFNFNNPRAGAGPIADETYGRLGGNGGGAPSAPQIRRYDAQGNPVR
jgi:hypothetical protein